MKHSVLLPNITLYLNEDFSGATGTTLPPGWQTAVIAGDPTVDRWHFDNPGQRTLPDFLTNPVAIFDSDAISNNDLAENVTLESPAFDASGTTQVFLEFKQEYLGLIDPQYGSEAFVEVYNGTTWQPVADQVNDVSGTTRIDISSFAAGVDNAQVRFRYTGNWSYRWAVDDVRIVNALTPGITQSGSPQVSESNVPDTRNFQFVLDSKPTAPVTLAFSVDRHQLQSIAPLTFTPDNWNVPQTATVSAVADGIPEGEDQKTSIGITVTSSDSLYNGFTLSPATATITDSTIPGFTSYRTVEKTYADLGAIATHHPQLASWIDIGDTYDKVTPGGASGYDIYALKLGSHAKPTTQPKPVFFVQAAIHAREYTTTELVTRFAEKLTAGYGVDADSTWLLDYVDIRVVPVVNPDGRKLAEQGYLWRKNANPTVPAGTDPVDFPLYGVDLNRNYASKWGEVVDGASPDPASETYQGPAPFSEPESQALRDYLLQTFPDQRGPNESDAAPDNATGIYLDLHSFGNLVLYPWGWAESPSPNYDGLRNLGLKFGYFTGTDGSAYDVQQGIGLYPTSGTTDDWVYTTFGAAAYTIELGTDFFQDTPYFEDTIVPEMTPALFYGAKAAHRPYQASKGPDSTTISLNQGQAVQGIHRSIGIVAIADDTRYDDDNLSSDGIKEGRRLPKRDAIAAARYSIDAPSWVDGTPLYAMTAVDGQFDKPRERVKGKIDVTGLAPGRHTIFVESQDATGAYGVPSAIFLDVLTAPSQAQSTFGSVEADSLTLAARNDVISSRGGDDTVLAGAGQDTVLAGWGNDTVKGDAGDDLLYGGRGDDWLYGGDGKDKLYGEDGSDRLFGSNGDDLLWGGKDNDVLWGGSGRDQFVLAYGEGKDTIRDFVVGEDQIGLAGTLTYDQLAIAQVNGAALIRFDTEVLARVAGVAASALTADSFVAVSSLV